jgi:hypothetical protein
MVHDGSYQPDKAADVCSAALVILCTSTGKFGVATASERTSPEIASNFRAECIGGILAGLILLSVEGQGNMTRRPTVIGCDNLGVISHANKPPGALAENQPQADVIRALRAILSKSTSPFEYTHVLGHQDDNTPFEALPLLNQLNVMADTQAKLALEQSIRTNRFISSTWPFETVRVYKGRTKITASIRKSLEFAWGREIAKSLYIKRGITDSAGFEKIAFHSIGRAMDSFPRGFRVWVCKEVSHFAGTNRMLSKFDDKVSNVCPNCGNADESTRHITTCPDPGRTALFEESVFALARWLEDTHMNESLILGILDYLLGRGTQQLRALLQHNPSLAHYATDHDHLGWQNFLEGRIASSLLALQERYLKEAGSRLRIQSWSTSFIQHLLGITHKQWIYRNVSIHLKVKDGHTAIEHRDLLDEVRNMMQTEPSDLLQRHQHLLDQDWYKMGSCTTSDRLQWLEQMDSALAAKRSYGTVPVHAEQTASNRPSGVGLPPRQRSNLSKRQCNPRRM